MNYLNRLLEFDTIEQGEKNLKEAENLRDSMCGGLYYKIMSDDCDEIRDKLYMMKLTIGGETVDTESDKQFM